MSRRRRVPLGDLAEIYDGPHATPSKTVDGPVFLGISNLAQGRLDLRVTEHLSEEDYLRWTRRVTPQPGDLVFSYETRLGEVARIPPGLECCLGRRMGLMRPRLGRVDGRFLLYAYLSPPFQETLRSRTVHGSTVDRIPLTEMARFPIEVPEEIGEQGRIAGILGTFDDKIELNQRMSATLEEIAKAIFRSWFVDFDPVRAKVAAIAEGRDPERAAMAAISGKTEADLDGLSESAVASLRATASLFPDSFLGPDFGEIPMGWELKPFGSVAAQRRRAASTASIDPEEPHVGLEHIPKRSLTLYDWRVGRAIGSQKSRFEMGEILFGKLRPYFHKVAIAPVSGVCSTDILVIVPVSADWEAFVAMAASEPSIIDFVTGSSDGTRMPRTSWADVARFPITLPPAQLASRFNGLVAPILRYLISVPHENRTLAAIRDALLPKLLAGELRICEVDDADTECDLALDCAKSEASI